MNAKDLLRHHLAQSRRVTMMLLGDLSDEDLAVRVTPTSNTIAWQLGHLISAERRFGEAVRAGSMPALPEGFEGKHTKERASSNDPPAYRKDEYLKLWNEQRDAIQRLLEEIDDKELDRPAPDSVKMIVANIGQLFHLVGSHELMHTGQYTSVRRHGGKARVF